MSTMSRLPGLVLAATVVAAFVTPALAYDGTNCKEPGVCWEPKPGYPEKIAGSKYDPKHNVAELNKQSETIKAMEQRNALRVANFKKTGKWVYEVDKLPK